jgi:hypothetical protein
MMNDLIVNSMVVDLPTDDRSSATTFSKVARDTYYLQDNITNSDEPSKIIMHSLQFVERNNQVQC